MKRKLLMMICAVVVVACATFPMAANAGRQGGRATAGGPGTPFDLQSEIDAAAARGGGVVRIAPGDHETKPFVLKSNITLELPEGARILASTNLADYVETPAKQCFFIYAENATNVAIVGKGEIDGRGTVFKERKKLPSEMPPQHRPLLIRFSRCRNLRLEGFHYGNSGSWGLHLQNCDGVKVKGVTCFNHSNKNNDGIDIESANVTVEDCVLDTDDDAVCFKTESDKSFPVTNVVVRNCRIASCADAVKFGTGSYNTFKDILIENCQLVRPKAATKYLGKWWTRKWAARLYDVSAKRIAGINAIALEVVDGGRMENVTIRNIEMEGYLSPILVRHHHRHEPDGEVDTYLRNVLIENVRGSADGRLASSITGVPARDGKSARRPYNITLRNIHLTVPGGGTAEDAADVVPEADGSYPDSFMFGKIPLPAYGFYVRHADRVKFENVTVTPRSSDARRPFVFDDCADCTVK